VRDVSVRSLKNWGWSIYEAFKAKCCVFLLWRLNYSGVSDRVVMSAIKNLSVCESYRHVGRTFGCFRKRLQAKVCFGRLILKFCSWNFVRLWKTTKSCFRIGSAALRQLKSEKFPVQTMKKYWGMRVWLHCLNLGIWWRRMVAPGSVIFKVNPHLLCLRTTHNTSASLACSLFIF
jgi:hypothetical protein